MERLTRIGGDSLRQKVIVLFLQRGPELLADIVQGAARSDAPAIEAASHSLKSSAGNIGAGALQAVCLRVEKRAEAADVDDLAEDLDALKGHLDATLSALDRWVTRGPASSSA